MRQLIENPVFEGQRDDFPQEMPPLFKDFLPPIEFLGQLVPSGGEAGEK